MVGLLVLGVGGGGGGGGDGGGWVDGGWGWGCGVGIRWDGSGVGIVLERGGWVVQRWIGVLMRGECWCCGWWWGGCCGVGVGDGGVDSVLVGVGNGSRVGGGRAGRVGVDGWCATGRVGGW